MANCSTSRTMGKAWETCNLTVVSFSMGQCATSGQGEATFLRLCLSLQCQGWYRDKPSHALMYQQSEVHRVHKTSQYIYQHELLAFSHLFIAWITPQYKASRFSGHIVVIYWKMCRDVESMQWSYWVSSVY